MTVFNDSVHCRTLRGMVVALHKIGNLCFPDILSVILSTEADSGLRPIVPVDGTDVKRIGHTIDIDMSVNLGMPNTASMTRRRALPCGLW
jgi:hypothetical protein